MNLVNSKIISKTCSFLFECLTLMKMLSFQREILGFWTKWINQNKWFSRSKKRKKSISSKITIRQEMTPLPLISSKILRLLKVDHSKDMGHQFEISLRLALLSSPHVMRMEWLSYGQRSRISKSVWLRFQELEPKE